MELVKHYLGKKRIKDEKKYTLKIESAADLMRSMDEFLTVDPRDLRESLDKLQSVFTNINKANLFFKASIKETPEDMEPISELLDSFFDARRINDQDAIKSLSEKYGRYQAKIARQIEEELNLND